MKTVLISPYEIGRQPFALAEPAAHLQAAGHEVVCLDLSLQRLAPAALQGAGFVAVYLGMHTATRIALAAWPRIRELAPQAVLAVYGLYAPMNAELFIQRGARFVLGGEPEQLLLAAVMRSATGSPAQPTITTSLAKIPFVTPDRTGLPPLEEYASLQMPGGGEKVVGFAEASRGCKHLCRHCPVVPVYQGRFRVVPADVVLADVRQQVAAGAEHISFGDPDFLNGPGHALRVVRALHAEFPTLGYDATIKIEHLVKHAELLPALAATGCVFVTSAVESVDERILDYLGKGHNGGDFERAVRLLNEAGIAFTPTFVPFTPWTTLAGYVELLARLVDLKLIENVAPIQLVIRLLIPQGSYLLQLPGFEELLDGFDPTLLGYRWRNRDPRVDALQLEVQRIAGEAEIDGCARVFSRIWGVAHAALGQPAPPLPAAGRPIPSMSEPWYCCAEPTAEQIAAF